MQLEELLFLKHKSSKLTFKLRGGGIIIMPPFDCAVPLLDQMVPEIKDLVT